MFLGLELEVDDEDEGCGLSTQFDSDPKDEFDVPSPVSVAQTFMKSLEEDPLYPCFINLN